MTPATVIIANKGRTPCGEECPYYEETGEVTLSGGRRKGHCRMIATNEILNCDLYDVRTMRTAQVSASDAAALVTNRTYHFVKPRRPYPMREPVDEYLIK